MTLGEIIKEYRLENKMSMDDFSAKSKLSKGYISMLEKNKNPKSGKEIIPSIETIKRVAIAVEKDFDTVFNLLNDQKISISSEKTDLIEDKSGDNYIESMKLPYKKVVPILGRIAAGRPICAIEEIEGYLPVTDPTIDFALRVQGDSMINARIFNGDIVQVQKDAYIKNGDIVVALIDGEDATVKRYYNYGDMVILKPENPTMHEWEFKPDEVQILGKVRRVTFNVY